MESPEINLMNTSEKNLPQKIVGLIAWPFGTPKEMESPVKVDKEKSTIDSTPITSLTTSSFSYQDFVNRMKLAQCSDMVNDVRNFVQQFSKQNSRYPWQDTVSEVTSFISKMQETMSKHSLWIDSSKIELDNGYDGMEKLILSKIYNKVFKRFSIEDQELNDTLTSKISQLQFIQPAHLDITQPYWNHPSLTQAQTELKRIDQYKSPRDKLVCLLNSCKIINGLVLQIKSLSATRVSADEFFPLLIYAILRARPPQLWLHVLYIQSFRRVAKLSGEPGYFITHIKCAMSFIENITAHSLSISVDEYNRLLSNNNNNNSQQSQFTNPFENNENNDSVNNKHPYDKSLSNDSATNQNQDIVNQDIVDTHTNNSIESDSLYKNKNKNPNSTIEHNNSILSLTEIENDLPQINNNADSKNTTTISLSFLDTRSDKLCLGDIPKLLKEYKLLASIVEQDEHSQIIRTGS